MLIYERLYLSHYKSKLYPSWYKRDEGGDNEVLVTVWLEVWLEVWFKVKDELKLILQLRDH